MKKDELRCTYCNKLLCYAKGVEISIKCPRCRRIITIEDKLKKAIEHLVKVYDGTMVSPSENGKD